MTDKCVKKYGFLCKIRLMYKNVVLLERHSNAQTFHLEKSLLYSVVTGRQEPDGSGHETCYTIDDSIVQYINN